tara:strand:+ start:4329 stop:4535 length:207 start_codon:yes stop_codon:yes gene_type:complete
MSKSIQVRLEYLDREEWVEETVHDPRQWVDDLLTNPNLKKGLKKIYVNGVLWWEGASYKLNKENGVPN